MKKNVFYLFVLAFLFVSCSGADTLTDVPKPVKELIKKEEKKPCLSTVVEYVYDGETVFLFKNNEKCPDEYDCVYDKNANFICSPWKQVGSSGDGKCEDFGSESKYVRIVYTVQ